MEITTDKEIGYYIEKYGAEYCLEVIKKGLAKKTQWHTVLKRMKLNQLQRTAKDVGVCHCGTRAILIERLTQDLYSNKSFMNWN